MCIQLSFQNFYFNSGALNALDLSQKVFSTSLKGENIANMISMFYSHHVVESAVGRNCKTHFKEKCHNLNTVRNKFSKKLCVFISIL